MHNAEVTVQVKYNPKGECIYCSDSPENIKPQDWHNYLSQHLPIHPLSGGRAAFYCTHEELAKLKLLEGVVLEDF